MKSPIPIIDDITKAPIDGILCKTHNFCKSNFNSKCTNHYKKCTTEGIYTCPYGFSTIVKKVDTTFNIYTSLNIEKLSKGKWLKTIIKKNDNSIKLPISSFNEIIKDYQFQKAEHNYSKNAVRSIDKKENIVNDKKELLDDTLHELRRINKQLKKQAFFLDKELENNNFKYESIREKAKNILSSAQLVSVRLNAYDFTLNPDLVETGYKSNTFIYRKFEKAKHCLSVYAESKHIKLEFIGKSFQKIDVYEIFDILPFVLFENAIKYSPENGVIECEFIESYGKLLSIRINNIGPLLNPDEIPGILRKGIRGKSVMENIKGTGKGLHIVTQICDYNNLNFEIFSKPINEKLSEFTAILRF